MKKTISLSLTFLLLTNSFAATIKTCSEPTITEYFPIGDDRGHSVLTKHEEIRECNVSIKINGPCVKWEEKDEYTKINPSNYNTYKSNSHRGSLEEVFSQVAALDQINDLWSGWQGYCVKGLKSDFSWAKDPMFWANLAMSTLMEGSQKDGFLNGTDLGNSVNNGVSSANNAAGNAWKGLGEKVGLKLKESFGPCLVSGALDVSKTMANILSEDDEIECNPVDEFCEEKAVSEEEIMTMDVSDYETLVKEHKDTIDKYIEVLQPPEDNNGIVTLRFKHPSELESMDKNSKKEMEEAKEKLKQAKILISGAMIGLKMARCAGTGKNYSTVGSTTSDDGRLSAKMGIGLMIDNFPASWGGPYTALIKAGLSVALELASSFKKVNTCKKEKDAKEAGTRHKKTQEAIPFNLCKETEHFCAQKALLFGKCNLKGYHYCCYDQVLTKTLVVQIKAQLGKDWSNCTGITLKDIENVSFRQCNEEDKKKGLDGAKMILIRNYKGDVTQDINFSKSFQYKAKCLDFTEFKNELSATVNSEIDFSDFDDIFSDVKKEKTNSGF